MFTGMVNFQKWMIFDLSVSSKIGCLCVLVPILDDLWYIGTQ